MDAATGVAAAAAAAAAMAAFVESLISLQVLNFCLFLFNGIPLIIFHLSKEKEKFFFLTVKLLCCLSFRPLNRDFFVTDLGSFVIVVMAKLALQKNVEKTMCLWQLLSDDKTTWNP